MSGAGCWMVLLVEAQLLFLSNSLGFKHTCRLATVDTHTHHLSYDGGAARAQVTGQRQKKNKERDVSFSLSISYVRYRLKLSCTHSRKEAIVYISGTKQVYNTRKKREWCSIKCALIKDFR